MHVMWEFYILLFTIWMWNKYLIWSKCINAFIYTTRALYLIPKCISLSYGILSGCKKRKKRKKRKRKHRDCVKSTSLLMSVKIQSRVCLGPLGETKSQINTFQKIVLISNLKGLFAQLQLQLCKVCQYKMSNMPGKFSTVYRFSPDLIKLLQEVLIIVVLPPIA